MALTLTEGAKLSNDVLKRGVIDTIVKESSLLMMLPFSELVGTALTYNREATMPAAAFYIPGDTWTEATPTFTQITETLKIMGGDAEVDNFIAQSYANVNDLEAEVLIKRAKATAHKFADTFYNGDSSVDTKSFDGLAKRLAGNPTQEISMGTNGAQLTLDMMDQVIDAVSPGRPDAILCSKRTRRKLSSLRRASGNLLETGLDMFGRHVITYDGIPVLVDDFISNTETQGSSGPVCSSVFCVKWGDAGVGGLQNSGGINIVEVGDLETKDATKWRIKWYATITIYSLLGTSRLKGILP